MVQPPEQRLVVESKIATPGTVANNAVKSAAQAALNADPAVKQAAATLAQSDAGLVKKGDPGVATEQGGAGIAESLIWLGPGQRKIMALLRTNVLKVFKGIDVGGQVYRHEANGDMTRASMDRNKRLGEDTIGLDGNVPAWVLARWKARMGIGALPVAPVNTVVTVKPDGTGDYLSPKLANDAFTPGEGKTLEVIIHPGRYTETEWTVKKGVHLRGTNLAKCILAGALPDTATDTQITNTSTIWLKESCTLENLTITAKNMRYAVHSEASGAFPDSTHHIKNCWIEHYGNQSAKDYRAANGIPAGSVWSSDRAWGYGSSSGWYERFENTTLVSRREAWYVHDNKDFTRPMNHDLVGCRLIARDADGFVSLQSLGSGVDSRVNVYDTEASFAFVLDSDNPWITVKPENQVANHSQIHYTQNGTSPVGYQPFMRGRALRIQSSSTAAVSSVRVAGTAATAVFGTDPNYRDGGGGLKGYAYGHWDISGILAGLSSNVTVDNTLGRRLGDCSVTPKTLTVTVDGGAPINVVFNTNLTAEVNATILTTINTALGSVATATEYDVTDGEVYPDFVDRQRHAKNTGTAGIPRFSALKRGTLLNEVVLMQTTDTVDKFIGVALEPIPPGQFGRILTSGRLRQLSNQIPGVTTTINAGASIYLSDTEDGKFSTAGTRKVMTVQITGWATFEGAK